MYRTSAGRRALRRPSDEKGCSFTVEVHLKSDPTDEAADSLRMRGRQAGNVPANGGFRGADHSGVERLRSTLRRQAGPITFSSEGDCRREPLRDNFRVACKRGLGGLARCLT